jgi:hypothetical protein
MKPLLQNLLWLVAFLFPCWCVAQPAADGDRAGGNTFLSSSNVKEFEGLLIAPLASLAENSLFAARVAQELEEQWRFSTAWNQASRENERHFSLGAEGELIKDGLAAPPAIFGFPFGFQGVESGSDAERGRKILWNVLSIASIDPQQLYGFELLWFGNKGITRQASGLYFREHLQGRELQFAEKAELSLPRSNQPVEWRELFQLLRPAIVFGYTSLTYRYKGGAEDDLWTFSPVLGRSRKVLESNRTDSILGGSLTLNDLFLVSGRSELYSPTLVGEKRILSPFPQRESLKPEPEVMGEGEALFTARGYYRNRQGQNASVLWNADSGTFIGLPGWIPSTIKLVPRDLFIVELNPRDPFAQHGTEVLFVDKQTFLPFYKVVYDRRGVFLRFLIASWNLVTGSDERVRFPALSFVLAIEKSGDKAQAFEVQYVRRLTGESVLRKKLERLFDIREHDKRAPKSAPTPAVPSESVVKEVSE